MSKQQKSPLTARLDERFAAPLRNAAFARRTWFSVTLALIVGIHLALLAVLLWRDSHDPSLQAQAEETPVEVVVEPRQQPASQPATPATEKPATSAPRAPNEDTERDANDKDTHAPKSTATAAAPPPPSTASNEKSDSEQADSEQAKADPAPEHTDAPKPPVVDREAEALDKAPPQPPRKPAALAKAKPKPAKPSQTKTALQQLAGASDLPDFSIAKPMHKRAKVTGGTEDDRYLAVVYGLIMQNQRKIALPTGEDWFVTVTFQVDGGGNLLAINLEHSSGYRPIDMAAIESVESAAPFPPPPSGSTTGLIARLHSPGDTGALPPGD